MVSNRSSNRPIKDTAVLLVLIVLLLEILANIVVGEIEDTRLLLLAARARALFGWCDVWSRLLLLGARCGRAEGRADRVRGEVGL